MLTSKQKKFLRAQAHHVEATFQIGKGGINEHLFRHIQEAIETRELLKVQVLNNCLADKQHMAQRVAKETGSELVQLIGSTIILYKPSRDHKKIELP